MKTIKDSEIIRQIQNGNKEMLNLLMEKYYDDILYFCIYQIHDLSNAYDITQETFCRFLCHIDVYCDRNLKAYLLTIAKNLCADYWKQHKKTLQNVSVQVLPESDIPGSEQVEFERVENRIVLSKMLNCISPEQREAIILRYYYDLKLSEIANILNLNLSTVKSRIRLGIKEMKRRKGRTDSE